MLMFNEVIIILRVTILEADVRKNSRRALTIEEGNNVDNVASLVSTLHFYYYSVHHNYLSYSECVIIIIINSYVLL